MMWKSFDADKEQEDVIHEACHFAKSILIEEEKDGRTTEIIQDFEAGKRPDLNQIIIVNTFKPNEFNEFDQYDQSLLFFLEWLITQNVDWNKGSKTLQKKIDDKFEKINGKKIEGGREYVILDNLIRINNNIIAIEIETSNNLDNGIWSLREAVKIKRANFGLMIVPWFNTKSGQVNEGNALGRIDREFDEKEDVRDGPIFRISPIRKIDALKLLKEQK